MIIPLFFLFPYISNFYLKSSGPYRGITIFKIYVILDRRTGKYPCLLTRHVGNLETRIGAFFINRLCHIGGKNIQVDYPGQEPIERVEMQLIRIVIIPSFIASNLLKSVG